MNVYIQRKFRFDVFRMLVCILLHIYITECMQFKNGAKESEKRIGEREMLTRKRGDAHKLFKYYIFHTHSSEFVWSN